jgi:drug/metabolite transporter (DMT)-like permease
MKKKLLNKINYFIDDIDNKNNDLNVLNIDNNNKNYNKNNIINEKTFSTIIEEENKSNTDNDVNSNNDNNNKKENLILCNNENIDKNNNHNELNQKFNLNLNDNKNKNHNTQYSNMISSDNDIIKLRKEEKKYELRKTIIGLILLSIVVIITVASSAVIKSVTETVKPFLFCYLNYNFYLVFILVDKIKNWYKKRQENNFDTDTEDNKIYTIRDHVRRDSGFSIEMRRFDSEVESSYENNFVCLTIILSLLWYMSNAFYSYALTFTYITNVNCISSSSIIWVLFLEYFFLIKGDKRQNFISFWKIFAVLFTISGLVNITIFNHNQNNNTKEENEPNSIKKTIIGFSLSLSSSIIYSIYSVYFKYQSLKYAEKFNIVEIFGFMGLFNLLIIPFLLIILQIIKLEIFKIPTLEEFYWISANGFFAVILNDFLMCYCILLLNPELVSFGITMTVPCSYIFDIFIKKDFEFNIIYLLGLICLIIGFAFISFEYWVKKKNENNFDESENNNKNNYKNEIEEIEIENNNKNN